MDRHHYSPARLLTAAHIRSVLGAALVALGTMVIIGWWLRQPAMVQVFPESVAMGFNTALGFIFLGSALIAPVMFPRIYPQVQVVFGYVVIALASTILIEQIWDIDLGIDQAALHRWINDSNPRPGRTAPNTCIAFILAGSILVLMHRLSARRARQFVPVLTALLAVIGIVGVIGYLIHLEALYRWYQFNRMALPTAIGMVVAAFGLWAAWRNAAWYEQGYWKREDQRIGFVAAALFIFIASATGILMFINLQGSNEKTLSDSLLQTLTHRVDIFQHAADQADALVASVAHRPNLLRMVRKLDTNKGDAAARKAVEEIVQSVSALDFSAIAIYDTQGNVLIQAGQFVEHSDWRFDLKDRGSTLLWERGFILSMHAPLIDQGVTVGTLMIEQQQPILTKFVTGGSGVLKSEEMLICAPHADTITCLPTRLNPAGIVLAHFNSEGKRFPISRALQGERGVVKVIKDYRKENVIAAFGPIGSLGLGMVIKADTSEFYLPVRQQLQQVLPLLLIMVVIGTWVLNAQVKPLVAKLVDSEREARRAMRALEEKERRLRAIVEHVAEGIITIDAQGVIEAFNPAAAKMFGYQVDEVIGRNIKMLMPEEMRLAHAHGMSRYLQEGTAHVIGKDGVELPGLRKDGSTMPMELAITEIQLEGRRLFVGIVRDITERKLGEARLIYLAQHDALTDLPNRTLFHDRLTQAMARSRRSKQIVTLMYLDIDHFKHINDKFGHSVGDALLRGFAERLNQCVRAVDTVARLGGDEFTIIAEGLHDARDASVIADKILRQMRLEFRLENSLINISASIGVAHYAGDDQSADAFIKNADAALYRAKEQGRDQYVIATTRAE